MTSTQRVSALGARAPRKEDHRLLTGRGRFGSDVQRTKMLHARVIRSSVAHASGLSIDSSAARALPGVVDVVTAADLPGDLSIPVRLKVQNIDLTDHLQPVLAGSTVRYVGEPVAVVLAEDAYLAEDAAELVTVEFAREEDVAIDAVQGGTVAADFTLGYGDIDAAFAEAAHVVGLTFDVGRHTAVPMEPRSLVVDIDPTATSIEIFGATKVPVFNQTTLAGMLGWDPAAIRMHAVDAGGGFGVRGEFYPEDFLIPWLAIRSRRPVSWIEDRAEHLVAVNHSRQQHHRIEVALTDDGTILGLRDDVVHDNGAYARTHGIIVPELTLAMLPGPYRVPAYEGRARAVLTNKTPCGTYRAPGRFEGTTVREQLIDLAADRLGIDRVELRRRNLLRSEELPHRRPVNTLGTDVVLDAGDYGGLLDKALARVRELGWQREVDSARDTGRAVGLGVVMFLEKSGLGPHETADVEVTRSGRVRVHSGGTSLGQASRPPWRRSSRTSSRSTWTGSTWLTVTRYCNRSAPDHGPADRRCSPATRFREPDVRWPRAWSSSLHGCSKCPRMTWSWCRAPCRWSGSPAAPPRTRRSPPPPSRAAGTWRMARRPVSAHATASASTT